MCPATYESGFITTLGAKFNPTDTTMTLATVPTVTSGRLYLTNGAQEEWVKFTGVSGSTVTGCVRGLSKTTNPAVAGTGLSWIAGTKVKLVAMHDQLPDEDIGNLFGGDNTFSGTNTYTAPLVMSGSAAPLRLANMTTTQRNALTPALGYKVYDTTEGKEYTYKATGRASVDTGTAVSNASETVAGIVEAATTAETMAGTDTGGTGALLFPHPSDLGVGVGNVISLTAGEDLTAGNLLCYNSTTAAETITQTSTGTDYNVGKASAFANVGMPITMSAVGYYQRINTITFDLKKAGSPTDNISVSIYNDDRITVIDTSDTVDATGLAGTYATKTFTFSGEQNLVPGKTYFLCIRRSGAESDANYVIVDGAAAATYVAHTFDAADRTAQTYGFKTVIGITTYAIDTTTVKKMDSNASLLLQYAGIALETKSSAAAVKVQVAGVVSILTGLTPNANYYASDTPGALSVTPSTTYYKKIGRALSATQLLIDRKDIFYYPRNFLAANAIYNGAAVDYNTAFSNKYIRVYTGFRPTIIRTRFFTTGAVYLSGTGYSDGTINRGVYSSVTANTIATALTATSFYIITSAAGTITGTVNFLDNGFEIYYSKTSAEALTGVGYLSFDVE